MDVREIALHVVSHRHVGKAPTERIHRGWYVARPIWSAWRSEQRQVARVVAVTRSMSANSDVVVSHLSAAAVHGWPLFRTRDTRVHLSSAGLSGHLSERAGIARHERDADESRMEVHGIPVTDRARTVSDIVGTVGLETAVSIADAALREEAWDARARTYDLERADAWKESVLAQPPLGRGRRGAVQGRWVVRFADGRAQLPGESISRLYLDRLGFAPPRLQVHVVVAPGEEYWLDFGLDDAGAWGEFDGIGKYTDPAMLGERTSAEALIAEKWREDRLRGTTGRPVLRWGMPHIASAANLGSHLAQFGALPGIRRRH